MTDTKALKQSDLRQFSGSEHWYRHALVRKVVYTDGAKYVADQGGAYWLLDAIAFAQMIPAVAAEEFQLWTLIVCPDHTARLVCGDGNGHAVHTQEIPFTDFPLAEIKFYFVNNTILLPSEY